MFELIKGPLIKCNGRSSTVMYVCMYVALCMVITYSKSMDQPGKVANPARGQLNRKIPLSPCVPENLEKSERIVHK